ncbi:MAG: leucine-rich repeat protein [Oscillospiraceae bacterium]|nr:leucine-rich repeat protein [Oscillospiraceae bacterium]
MKTKSIRQFAAAALSLCLFAGTPSIPAGAVGLITEDNPQGLRYNIYEGSARIMDCDDSVRDLVIPETIDGLPVTGFAGLGTFMGDERLVSISLPATFEDLGPYDLIRCPNLTSITVADGNPSLYDIDGVPFAKGEDGDYLSVYPAGREGAYAIPEGIRSIGYYAMDECDKLTSLSIPASMTYQEEIGNWLSSTSVTEITVAEDNPDYTAVDGVLYSKDKTQLLYYPGGRQGDFTVPDGVTTVRFNHCAGLTGLTLPESVTNIQGIYDCPALTELTLPEGLTEIYRIDNCDALTTLTLPDSVTSFGGVSNCDALTTLTLPAALESYPDIYNCEGLTSVNVPEGAASFPQLNHCPAITELHVPDGVTSLSIENCTGLTRINIPDSIESISEYTFRGCTALSEFVISDSHPTLTYRDGMILKDGTVVYCLPGKEGAVTVPEGVNEIGNYAFRDCAGITSVTIPDSVTVIGYDAFQNCTTLESVRLPEGLTRLSFETFSGCTSLSSITLPSGLEQLGRETFAGCTSLTTVDLPASLTGIDNSFAGCTSLTEFTLSGGSESFSVKDGVLYDKAGTTLVCCPAGKEGTFTVPDSVAKIGSHAFDGCEKLTQIVLPEGLESIYGYAFQGCTALTSMTIPEGAAFIFGGGMFRNCTSLKTVELPEGCTQELDRTFYGCTALEEITIPKSVTEIEQDSFYNCSPQLRVTILNPDCTLNNYNTIFVDDTKGFYYFHGTLCGYEGSTAQAHARINGYRFESLGLAQGVGDVNGDGNVNANDAAAVLMAAARIGAKRDSGLTGVQALAANVDRRNAAVNANDAAFILRYAAYHGAKGEKDIYEYFGIEQ